MSFTLAKFDPAEAERITGVSLALQRVWRQRGFLPSAGGKISSFTVHDLARMLFLKLMSDRGVRPADLVDSVILETSGRRVAYDALTNGEAYGPNYPSGGSLREFNLVRKIAQDESSGATLTSLMTQIKAARENEGWALRIAYAEAPKVIPGPLFIWSADGEPYWDGPAGENLEREFERSEGAIVVMVLPQVGKMLAQRAGRPLVTINEH